MRAAADLHGEVPNAVELDLLVVLALEERHGARFPRLCLVGDFNVAAEDRDVYDPEAWAGQVLCSELEREALEALRDLQRPLSVLCVQSLRECWLPDSGACRCLEAKHGVNELFIL